MNNDVDLPIAPRAATGQGTAIEQSRAITEVQAMVAIAQNSPRNMSRAIAAMQETCGQKALAEQAFFSFPRAGQTVQGPSIHLARELARVWGNITYGITELRRDDAARESEMLAYAWDVETNTRSASIFIVPHAKDTKRGRKDLTDLRDVYENNANQGARRVRESIYAVLPAWFTEQAQDVARAALRDGGGQPIAQRIANAVKLFESLGVTTKQLIEEVGRPTDEWTEHDVAELGVTYQSIQNGEVAKDDVFPPAKVTAAEITASVSADPQQDVPEPDGWEPK